MTASDITALQEIVGPLGYTTNVHASGITVGEYKDIFGTHGGVKLGAGTLEFISQGRGKELGFNYDVFQDGQLGRFFYDPNSRNVTFMVVIMPVSMHAFVVESWPSMPVNAFLKEIRDAAARATAPKRPAPQWIKSFANIVKGPKKPQA
jgi:hypothetical protein